MFGLEFKVLIEIPSSFTIVVGFRFQLCITFWLPEKSMLGIAGDGSCTCDLVTKREGLFSFWLLPGKVLTRYLLREQNGGGSLSINLHLSFSPLPKFQSKNKNFKWIKLFDSLVFLIPQKSHSVWYIFTSHSIGTESQLFDYRRCFRVSVEIPPGFQMKVHLISIS